MLEWAQAASRRKINGGYFVVSLLCFGYWLLLGFKFGWKLPGMKLWPILGTVLFLRSVAMHVVIQMGLATRVSPVKYFSVGAVCALVFAVFLTVLFIIARHAYKKCPPGMDYLIVLGCQSESKVLFIRCDAAAAYLQASPETKVIASGGQGSNEAISEAESISRRLQAQGIAPERIVLEDKSRNTIQNLRNAAAMLPEGSKVALVTDDYHQFRAGLIAKRVLGRKVYGLPVHSSKITLGHYIIREFFSCALLLVKTVLGKES
ncbi:MAG: YdcF family protein [Clostridia bacterium]|nr:YdcF family protein [Clostridia bacterium]